LSAFELYEGLLNGVVTGCVYALVALSLVIIYKSTDTINFAGGEIVMAGGYLGMLGLVYFGFNYVLVFLFGAAGMFFLGALFDRIVLNRVLGRAVPGKELFVAVVIATVGLSFAIKGRRAAVSLYRRGAPLAAGLPGPPAAPRPGIGAAPGPCHRRHRRSGHAGAVPVLSVYLHRQGIARDQ
jgi:branched-chain amino acid transport system permease protein